MQSKGSRAIKKGNLFPCGAIGSPCGEVGSPIQALGSPYEGSFQFSQEPCDPPDLAEESKPSPAQKVKKESPGESLGVSEGPG